MGFFRSTNCQGIQTYFSLITRIFDVQRAFNNYVEKKGCVVGRQNVYVCLCGVGEYLVRGHREGGPTGFSKKFITPFFERY